MREDSDPLLWSSRAHIRAGATTLSRQGIIASGIIASILYRSCACVYCDTSKWFGADLWYPLLHLTLLSRTWPCLYSREYPSEIILQKDDPPTKSLPFFALIEKKGESATEGRGRLSSMYPLVYFFATVRTALFANLYRGGI